MRRFCYDSGKGKRDSRDRMKGRPSYSVSFLSINTEYTHECQICTSTQKWVTLPTWPSGNLSFECQKKNCKNVKKILMSKNGKKYNFGGKKSRFWQFFDIQMAIFRRVKLSPNETNRWLFKIRFQYILAESLSIVGIPMPTLRQNPLTVVQKCTITSTRENTLQRK